MNRIERMIADRCPDGVDFENLGELVQIKNGSDYKHLGTGSVPVYGSGGIMTAVDRFVYSGPSVLIPRKGSLDKLYFVEGPFWTVDTIFYTIVGERIDPRFLFHYLANAHLENLNQAGGVPSLTQTVLKNLMIPVPPLEIQREIVTILDSFTKLEAELEAELEARRAQYAFYRDQLLNFESARKGGGRVFSAFRRSRSSGFPWVKSLPCLAGSLGRRRATSGSVAGVSSHTGMSTATSLLTLIRLSVFEWILARIRLNFVVVIFS